MNPSERIDELIAEITDWRGKTFASIRKSILEADREIIEEWKWMGSPVWSHDGIIAVANAHLFEGDKINERALKDLVRAAVDYNQIKLRREALAGTQAKLHKSKKR